jgi:pyruvate kinase
MGHTAHKPPADLFDDLIRQVEELRRETGEAASQQEAVLSLPPDRQASARNLLHYMALRNRDLRPLQDRLAHLGLSSIGRAEPHVMATLNAVLYNLCLVSGRPAPFAADEIYSAFESQCDLLEQNTYRLLGEAPKGRRAHIMVTMPSVAADDFMLVHQLIRNGMDCIRINCAHDSPAEWKRMIRQMRHSARATGQHCRVLMDLRGPKLRTGAMEPMPAVVKVRPTRDAFGEVTRPAHIWLSAGGVPSNEAAIADACLKVDTDWLAGCRQGESIRLRDARGSKRRWKIREVGATGCWAESLKTTYLVDGTVLRRKGSQRDTELTGLPAAPSSIMLRRGDVLLMSLHGELGRPAVLDDDGKQLSPGRVCVPIPEIYRDTRPGEQVCFDDGRITGLIEKRPDRQLQIRITHTRKPVEKLSADKGVNFPDTRLGLPAMSREDLQDLEFVARNADMVGLSFTNTPDDVRSLRERLTELGASELGVVLKIETRQGFANLPEILLEAMKFPACGVMIARGDLAVECGFERLAELQEEILWVCESAHVPVIWATQVLEGLSKRGHASRAEITDAAMSQAAECVMLNKGPYINDAVNTLDNILRRMQGHQSKKRSMMRRLQLAENFHGEHR